ncbi:MAG TPA: hypothetical protein VGS80_16330, partial [Ktedonobacterales bacterium]|nr:hypothetical protein [Ktedonobacterales bacterium]
MTGERRGAGAPDLQGPTAANARPGAEEQALAAVVWPCRALDTTAREQRTTWWERGQDTRATSSHQQAELPDLKVACPADAAINAQVVPEVLVRVERTCQACF